MCDCVKQAKEKFKEMFPEAEKVEFASQLFSTVKVKMPGRKKPTAHILLHSHCPMCGKKYGEANPNA